MTNADLWAVVGAELRRIRVDLGFPSTIALATAINDQHFQKTLDRIERGEVGQVRSINRYCESVGTTLPDVLRAVLPAGSISARAQQVAEAYDALPAVQQLVDVALGLPRKSRVPERVPAPPAGAPQASDGDSHGRKRTARGRR